LPKTSFRTKFDKSGIGEHPKNFGTPSYRQLLNLTTSNLVYNLVMRSSLITKITFRTKIGGSLELEEHPKNL